MTNKAKPVLSRLTALVLAALLLASTARATAGTPLLRTERALLSGLKYIDTVTQGAGGRVESYALEYTPGGNVTPIMLQGSGTMCNGASINTAVANAQALGYHVVGAVNTDFFSTRTGIPMGISIEDGVYKSSPENECAVTVTDGAVGLVETPQVQMVLTNLTNQGGQAPVTVTHLNKNRAATGGLYLLNEYFSPDTTRTSTPGWMVRLKELEGQELTVSGTLQLQVMEVLHTPWAWRIGEGEYVLTADDSSGYGEVFSHFQVGDRVALETRCNSPALTQAQWAGGAGDVMLRDGQLTDSTQWTYARDGRAPRTALGVREDGSALIYVADGRQSGYSAGLSQTDLAQELQAQGCRWAVNLDGGGSSAMSVWVPGQSGPALVNKPSDGSPRACATYMLLVSPDAGNGTPERLALKDDGVLVLAGSSVDLGGASVLDSGLNPLETDAGEVSMTSQNGLGSIEGTTYTAGAQAGSDTLALASPALGVEGGAAVHVVSTLTELDVLKSGSGEPLASVALEGGEQLQLTARGSYWSRLALRGADGVTWSVQGGIGSIDSKGLFTAYRGGPTSGSITASAGGLTVTIPVSLTDLHTDVIPSHWAYDAVVYCYENNLVTGITADRFGPDQNIRRGDFVLMLYRAVGSPAPASAPGFTDVAPSDYYANAIAWARENGLITGLEDGSYHPAADITREAAFTILNRALPLLGVQCQQGDAGALAQFTDAGAVSPWATGHVATLVSGGIVGGSGGMLDPQGNLSRAQMAALLFKLSLLSSDEPAPPDGTEPDLPDVPGTDPEPEPDPEPDPSDDGGQEEQDVPGWLQTGKGGSDDDPSRIPVEVVSPSDAVLDFETDVEIIPGVTTGTVRTDTGVLNVRSGPGTGYDKLDTLENGAKVLILAKADGGWYYIRYANASGASAEGYVSGDFITIDK